MALVFALTKDRHLVFSRPFPVPKLHPHFLYGDTIIIPIPQRDEDGNEDKALVKKDG